MTLSTRLKFGNLLQEELKMNVVVFISRKRMNIQRAFWEKIHN